MSASLAARLAVIKPSATIAISERAAALRAQGQDVIAFGVGEPDFATPAHARDAAKKALDAGATKYTAVSGILPLRQAISADSTRRRGVTHATNEIVVSTGAKQALMNLALALFDVGDEVIIPAPYWVSYPEQAAVVGATVRVVETREEDGFLLTPAALREALTPRTKAIVLCTPSNPTGSAYSEPQLRALADVLRAHDCWIILDEIYGELVYGDFRQVSLLTVAPDLKDRIALVDGVSKTYAMTGFRIGWVLAPAALAKACDTMQGQSTSGAAAVTQHAALAALTGDRAEVDAMRAEFAARRELMCAGLAAIPGITCRMPEGAFYAFPSVRGLYGKRAGERLLSDDVAIAEWLLEAARCAIVPGAAFGAPGYLRLSYATSRELIAEGVRRIDAAVRSLAR